MKTKGKVLIVDDNKDVLSALEVLLEDEFESLVCISNPSSINHQLESLHPEAVLLDMNFNTRVNTGNEGMFWLKKIKEFDPYIEVVMFTAYGEVNLAVNAMKLGATDFVLKPWDNEKLTATLKTAVRLSQSQKDSRTLKVQNEYLKDSVSSTPEFIDSNSDAFEHINKTIHKVSPTDANVMITGENGTGKSLLARKIHNSSLRKDEAFIAVDLGSIHHQLFESELFGHKKGAFTDAQSDKVGRLKAADGGTLFLDEIGNLPLELQVKLLQVLQERKVTPLGSNKAESFDIRLITATNRPEKDLKNPEIFREDLLYRINTITIEMPPLRSRTDDLPKFTEAFLNKYKNKYSNQKLKVSDDFIEAIKEYEWPGNIRELEHTIERCVILSSSSILTSDDLQFKSLQNNPKTSGSLEEIEKQAILDAIKRNSGNLLRAAKDLNITRQTIYNKMKKYGL